MLGIFISFHKMDCHQNHYTANATEHANCKTADEVDEWKRRDFATGLVQDDEWAVTLTPL